MHVKQRSSVAHLQAPPQGKGLSDSDESDAARRRGYDSDDDVEVTCFGAKSAEEKGARQRKSERPSTLRRVLFGCFFLACGFIFTTFFLPALLLPDSPDQVASLEGRAELKAHPQDPAPPSPIIEALRPSAADLAPLKEGAEAPRVLLEKRLVTFLAQDAPVGGGEGAKAGREASCSETCRNYVGEGGLRGWQKAGRAWWEAPGSADDEWECAQEWFPLLNKCNVLESAFPQAGPCVEDHFSRTLPALVQDQPGGGIVLSVNVKPDEYPSSCDASVKGHRRLCPCTPPAAGPQAKNLRERRRSVAAAVVQELRSAATDLRAGRKDRGDLNQWWSAHAPEELEEDISAKRVAFIESKQAQNCHDRCQEDGLACQRHWFDVLNTCNVLGLAFSAKTSCNAMFYGRDLPAYRPGDATALVNKEPRTYSSSCGGKHEKTVRLCGCGYKKGGSTSSRTFHTVYNVQPSKYFEWQVRYMHYWFKLAKMPGKITRLLSAGGTDYLATEDGIPTHVSPEYKSAPGDVYTPYNKPFSIMRWLEEAPPTEDVVVVVDPDCLFVGKLDIVVEEGSPVAQQAFYNFDFSLKNDAAIEVAKRYCVNCTFVDPIAVPIIIHRRDLMKIAPRWLAKTREIRADRANWPNHWNNRTASKVGLGWTAEMFGYVFAASELGIRHEIWHLQDVPPVHKELISPIIHYHVEVPLPDGRQWYKHTDDAGYKIPWPIPNNTDQVTRTLITKLHEAHEAVGHFNHIWTTKTKYAPEVRRRQRR